MLVEASHSEVVSTALQKQEVTRRSKDICLLQSFSQETELPKSIRARGHSLKIVGATRPDQFWIGAHGTNSKELCGHLAAVAGRKANLRTCTLDAYVRIPGLHSTRIQHTLDSVSDNGYIHHERTSMQLESFVQSWLCDWVHTNYGSKAVDRLGRKAKSGEILLQYADASFDLFDDMRLKLLVMPARLDIAPDKVLNVGLIKPHNSTEIERFEVRYLSGVKCKY